MGEMGRAEMRALYGEWAPRTSRDAAALMDGFDGDWWVAGGRALEAFTGVEREHDDLDVAILRADLPAFRDHVRGRFHVWAAFAGALKPVLPDDPDELPDGCGQVWLRPDAGSPWEFDVLLNPGSAGEWVNRREPQMTLALDDAAWVDTDGVRWLNPEIVLLLKAKHLRAKDRADFAAALPLLGEDQRAWLGEALAWAHPGHEWLARLEGEPDARHTGLEGLPPIDRARRHSHRRSRENSDRGGDGHQT
ncbi:hypothetical protein [Oryzihumus leptocrescens]|nr:hypothetical protein [Oryzihumus leptocrescens]